MSEIRFGGYRVLETIGSGALATLYKAEQESVGRTVAIKVLKSSIALSSSFAQQLDREARVLGDLSHPNVVLLVDYCASPREGGGGGSFLVLEYIDGPSLAELLSRRRMLRPEAAAAIALLVAEGLSHAHERGVVHRDVKPANVLLSRRGDVKIIDFGIAQRERLPSMNEPLPAPRRGERAHEAFGTPAYMSPEQILGDVVDARSDLFSLGVVLYRMLSGTRPFESESKAGERKIGSERLRRDSPVPLRERAPDMPRPLERIVMKLLQKSPADRHDSARELADELAAFLRQFSGASPQKLVLQTLAEAGYVREDAIRRGAAGMGRRTSFAVARTSVAVLGFLVIGAAFVLLALISEVLSPGARDVRAAGARPLELVPRTPGALKVLATPWAEVAVDGQVIDTTPFARAIPLAPGPHYVRLTHPDARPEHREITIRAGEIITLDVTLDLVETRDASAPLPSASASARPGTSASAGGNGKNR